MRTGTIDINRKTYILCFSARVIRACAERYGDVNKIDDVLSDDSDDVKKLDECFWLLAQMMDAGARYAKMEGVDNPTPLSTDDLLDIFDIESMSKLNESIKSTITNGSGRAIETKEQKGKNANATQRV